MYRDELPPLPELQRNLSNQVPSFFSSLKGLKRKPSLVAKRKLK